MDGRPPYKSLFPSFVPKENGASGFSQKTAVQGNLWEEEAPPQKRYFVAEPMDVDPKYF